MTTQITVRGAWKYFLPTIAAALVATYAFGSAGGAITYIVCSALTFMWIKRITAKV